MKKYFGLASVCLFCLFATNVNAQNMQSKNDINTPLATGGADYNVNTPTGLDDYNRKRRELMERAELLKREQEKLDYEYRVQVTRSKQAAAAAAANAKNTKTMSAQEYFDRQTAIMQGQDAKR